jgi:hypothetical protein
MTKNFQKQKNGQMKISQTSEKDLQTHLETVSAAFDISIFYIMLIPKQKCPL